MPMLPPIAIAEIAYSYAKMGNREEAEKRLEMLNEASKHTFVDPFFSATIYFGLGNKDRGNETKLEASAEIRSSLIPSISAIQNGMICVKNLVFKVY